MAFFPVLQPKFNRYSFPVVNSCNEKLLQHQSDALEALKVWFSRNDDVPGKALISMPTGSGKTGVISCLPYFIGSIGMEDCPSNFPTGNPRYKFDKPILVLAPSRDIADQLERQILVAAAEQTDNFLVRKKIVSDAFRREVLPNGVKIDGTAQLTHPDFIKDKDVIIANVHKFLSKKPSREDSRWWVEELPDDLFKIVIVDEAHHFPTPTWKRIIDKFRGHALVVFLTATPFRSDKEEIIEDVKDAVVFHLSLAQARDARVIRRTTLTVVKTAGKTDEQIFRAVLAKVKQIQDGKNRDQPLPGGVPHMAMAITKTKELANLVAETWNNFCDNGTAFAYYTDVPKELPQLPEIMNGIKRNQVKLLVVVGMLLEGFDHPPISIAAILTRIGSARKFVQFVGRAQRVVRSPHEEKPNVIADIVTHSIFEQDENYRKFEKEDFVNLIQT